MGRTNKSGINWKNPEELKTYNQRHRANNRAHYNAYHRGYYHGYRGQRLQQFVETELKRDADTLSTVTP